MNTVFDPSKFSAPFGHEIREALEKGSPRIDQAEGGAWWKYVVVKGCDGTPKAVLGKSKGGQGAVVVYSLEGSVMADYFPDLTPQEVVSYLKTPDSKGVEVDARWDCYNRLPLVMWFREQLQETGRMS